MKCFFLLTKNVTFAGRCSRSSNNINDDGRRFSLVFQSKTNVFGHILLGTR